MSIIQKINKMKKLSVTIVILISFISCDSRTEVQKLSDEACDCYDLRKNNPTIEDYEKYSSCLKPIIDKAVKLNEKDQQEYTERTIECVKSKGINLNFPE